MFKDFGKQKLIIVAILVLAIIATVLLLVFGKKQETQEYGEAYPVTATEKNNGKLQIELDGSKTPNVQWKWTVSENPDPVFTYTASAKDNATLRIEVTPNKSGYDTLRVRKIGTIENVSYVAATIYMDIYVEETEDGLGAFLREVREESEDVAVSTESDACPYVIHGNEVYLLGEEEWMLSNPDVTEGWDDDIAVGINDAGATYYRIEKISEGSEKPLVITNETTGETISLRAVLGEDEQISIEKVAEE